MYHQYSEGWVEVICGCMFAGKTEELIRRINVLSFAKKKIAIFKPKIDDRYEKSSVTSHNGNKVPCYPIEEPEEILDIIDDDVEVVAIDEGQFFGESLVEVTDYLASKGIRVIVAGLDTDFRGEAFGIMPQLLVRAEFVSKLTAVCSKCGAPATRTQRIINDVPASYNDPTILVGAVESYEPRCRHCHELKDKPKLIKK